MTRKRKPGGGRKPKAPDEVKDVVVSVKISRELKAKLDRARAGKPLSGHIAWRLAETLKRRRDQFGDERDRYLGMIVARQAESLRKLTGGHWRDDKWVYEALVAGLQVILFHLAPAGDPKMPDQLAATLADAQKRGWQG